MASISEDEGESLPTGEREFKSALSSGMPIASMSLPTGEREFKWSCVKGQKPGRESLPTGEREFKYILHGSNRDIIKVAPHRGA